MLRDDVKEKERKAKYPLGLVLRETCVMMCMMCAVRMLVAGGASGNDAGLGVVRMVRRGGRAGPRWDQAAVSHSLTLTHSFLFFDAALNMAAPSPPFLLGRWLTHLVAYGAAQLRTQHAGV